MVMSKSRNTIQQSFTQTKSKPFLKWVGGKSQLLDQFEPYFAAAFDSGNIKRYIEPFIGGGAVFFNLSNKDCLPETSFLYDNNEELTNTFQIVRDNLNDLITALSIHQEQHDREYYYHVRGQDRDSNLTLSNVERAARMIYLNRTCYNGLYRVNSKGQFNVPMGSYKNPKILHEDILLSASTALQNSVVEPRDFQFVLDIAKPKDFIYFDPPYDPLSKTSSFTSYTSGSFRDADQRRLAQVYSTLSERGCLCMLSNSYTPFILDLYKNYRIEKVQAVRAVNSDPNGRGAIDEVLVLNY